MDKVFRTLRLHFQYVIIAIITSFCAPSHAVDDLLTAHAKLMRQYIQDGNTNQVAKLLMTPYVDVDGFRFAPTDTTSWITFAAFKARWDIATLLLNNGASLAGCLKYTLNHDCRDFVSFSAFAFAPGHRSRSQAIVDFYQAWFVSDLNPKIHPLVFYQGLSRAALNAEDVKWFVPLVLAKGPKMSDALFESDRAQTGWVGVTAFFESTPQDVLLALMPILQFDRPDQFGNYIINALAWAGGGLPPYPAQFARGLAFVVDNVKPLPPMTRNKFGFGAYDLLFIQYNSGGFAHGSSCDWYPKFLVNYPVRAELKRLLELRYSPMDSWQFYNFATCSAPHFCACMYTN